MKCRTNLDSGNTPSRTGPGFHPNNTASPLRILFTVRCRTHERYTYSFQSIQCTHAHTHVYTKFRNNTHRAPLPSSCLHTHSLQLFPLRGDGEQYCVNVKRLASSLTAVKYMSLRSAIPFFRGNEIHERRRVHLYTYTYVVALISVEPFVSPGDQNEEKKIGKLEHA
ncbi:hypothetical protein SCHPADRAFT_457692 [Schizopora paradoxa]|uniref:Uncharacterized protein n=1 Tax=Schizopora paradoxa TaxID=27342 RepID=A0A0H2RQJ4_9AGAM|nr:hypothetical protein SCHPADRAFT_457692 [Schizopora paradoxa]